MKKSRINIFILFLLIVCACSDNHAFLPTPDIDEPDITMDTAYVSLAIDFDTYQATRGYEGEQVGSSAEDFVQKVRIVLFDGDKETSKIVKSFDYDIQTNTSGTGAWIDNSNDGKDLATTTDLNDKSQFKTYARKVPVMDLKMLVIVNITPELETLTKEGCTYGPLITNGVKVEKEASKTDNVGGLAQNNYFLMTSGPGLISVGKNKLKASIREAHNDPLAATVSRVVSKVTLLSSDGSETFPTNNGATIGDIEWELDITNRYTYWTIQGQTDGNRENWYWRDPNYSGYGSKPISELQNDFFYFAAAGNPYPPFKKRLKDSEYCLENTMDETDQENHKVITRVLIRCVYKPENVKTAGESFYVYNGKIYSINEMKEFAMETDKLPESLLTGLYKAIKEASQEDGYSFRTGIPVKNNQEVDEPFTTKGITYYYKGINYYAVKIRHIGENDLTTAYGHYGVLRNTHYTIKIDLIQGPGSPGILWDDIVTRSLPTEDNSLYNNIQSSIIYQ